MRYGEWIGRAALALIFLFNALGVVDQTRAAHELAAHGAPAALVPTLIVAGRVLQPLRTPESFGAYGLFRMDLASRQVTRLISLGMAFRPSVSSNVVIATSRATPITT